jgi:quinoprotein glucose dehydrogenase
MGQITFCKVEVTRRCCRATGPQFIRSVGLVLGFVLGLMACSQPAVVRDSAAPVEEWPAYGNDPGSSRYSPLTEITKANVGSLKVAWTYRTGDVSEGNSTWEGKKVWARSTFEATPLMVDDTLYIVTPFDRIIALDPETGKQKWVFDPKLNRIGYYGDDFTCRGLATWVDHTVEHGEACYRMVYEETLDGRLIAVDARTGKACAGFGTAGQVSLMPGINLASGINHPIPGEYHFTSAPAVVGNVVVVGSAINDNDRVEMPSGGVRGYDARTGDLLWAWDAVPRDPADPARATWQNGADHTGAANVWGPISADIEHDLVFLPTTSPSPDYYGGERKGANRNADSLVVLRASSGKLIWAFQAVHHDLWDYDLPSGPSLIEVERDGKRIAALAQPSKMGHLFILDRDSGAALLPVEERPVPQEGVPGEELSPTQPFPIAPPRLVPDRLEPQDAWGITPWERAACRQTITGLRRGGIFTPPSFQGTLQYPGNAGGTNWGGLSFDRARGLLVVNQTSLPFIAQLIPREQVSELRQRDGGEEGGWEYAPMKGTPYVMRRRALLSPSGLPCNPPPWGTLAAVEASTGRIRWQVPLGTMRELAPLPLPIHWGTPTLGGPLTTASGITFIGATMDSTFRAFETETGRELWHIGLPASAIATPMTYRAREGGRQYVVVAVGGHGKAKGIKLGDYVMAFALP